MKLTKKEIQFFESLDRPICVMTETTRHDIFVTGQCCECGVMSDPHMGEEIYGKGYCFRCGEEYWEKHPEK